MDYFFPILEIIFKMERSCRYINMFVKYLTAICTKKLTFPSYLALLMLSFKILYPQTYKLQMIEILMAFCVAFTLISGQSYYYILGPILYSSSIYLNVLNLTIGLVTANEKWKLYVYVLSIVQFLNANFNNGNIEIFLCACIYVTWETYHNFLFGKSHNKICFIILLNLAITLVILKVLQLLFLDEYRNYAIVTSIVFFSKLIQMIYQNRIQKLINRTIKQLNSSYQADVYIQQYQQRLKTARFRHSLIWQHKSQCQNMNCLCRTQSLGSFDQNLDIYLIESLYKDFLNSTNKQNHEHLYHKFINFKIKQGKLIEVICMLQSLNFTASKNLFILVQRIRSKETLRNLLLELDQTLCWKNIYLQGLEYDRNLSYLVQKMQTIIWLKIEFLKEIAKQYSQLGKIEKAGIQTIYQFDKLHEFFQRKILKLEQKLNCYTATILYCFYLICITNSTQYPRMIIKKTKQKFQQSQSNDIQKYEIQTICIQNINSRIDTKNAQSNQLKIQPQMKNTMLIKNVSQSFCKLAKTKKSQLVGTEIQNLIPPIYRKDHDKLVKSVFHGVHDSNSKLLNNRRLYPVYLGQNQAALITINLKVMIQDNNRLGFLALLQPIPRKYKLILTNFKFENLSAEPFCDYLILQSVELRKQIWKKKKQWITQSIFLSSETIIDFKEDRFTVKISSPSQHRFIQAKQQLPIHVQIKNQIENDPTKTENYIKINNDMNVRRYLEKIEDELMPSVYSQETNGTTKISISYLKALSKVKTFSFFKLLYFGIASLIAVSIASAGIQCNILTLNSSSSSDFKDLAMNLETLRKIKISFIEVLSYSFDLYARNQQIFSQQKISDLYGQVNYSSFAEIMLLQKFQSLNKRVIYELPDFDGQAQQVSYQILHNQFFIAGLNGNYTLYGLLKNCLIDVQIIANTKSENFNETILRKYYLTLLQPYLQKYVIHLNQLIQHQFDLHLYGNIAMSISFSVILVILLIPIHIFFKRYTKHRLDFYDILISVQGIYIKQQIQTLQKLNEFVEKRQDYHNAQLSSDRLFSSKNYESKQSLASSKVIISNRRRTQIQTITIRKKTGQLNQKESSQAKSKIISLRRFTMVLILIFSVSFLLIGGIKLLFYSQIRQLQINGNQNRYFNQQVQQSLLCLKDLASKMFLQNRTKQEITKQYETSKQKIQQIQQLANYIALSEKIIPCSSQFQTLAICQKQYSQSALINLLLSTQKNFLELYDKQELKQNAGYLLNFGSIIMIRLNQAFDYNVYSRSLKRQQILKQQNKWLVSLEIIIYLQCLLLIAFTLYLCYTTVYIYLKETQFLLLFSLQAIESNKRIQQFMKKISKY